MASPRSYEVRWYASQQRRLLYLSKLQHRDIKKRIFHHHSLAKSVNQLEIHATQSISCSSDTNILPTILVQQELQFISFQFT